MELQAIQFMKKVKDIELGKKDVNELINDFLDVWDCKQHMSFLKEIIPLIELYDVDEEADWVKDAVGEEDERNVRLIRTVYLVSRIAEFHAGKLASIKMNFKDLFKKMEKANLEVKSNEDVIKL